MNEKRETGSNWACPVFSDSEEGIISGLFGFKVGWGLVVKTGVESGAIVEGLDVIEDGGASLGAGGEAMMIDQFVFEAAKEGLDEGVIVAVGFAAHGRD